jgi:hypothetical protein
MKLGALILLLVASAALIAVAILGLTSSSPKTTDVRVQFSPLCTPAAVSQLANYWNAQISQASYANLQNTEANAIAATAQRLDYCKAHS